MPKVLQQYKQANQAQLFSAFISGSPLEDIAEEFGVALSTLRTTARREGWNRIALLHMPDKDADMGGALALDALKRNREKNLKQAEDFRAEVDKTIYDVTAGGAVAMAPSTLKEIGSAMSTAHDLTYRAVGDKDKQQNSKQGSTDKVPTITINLPTQIAGARGGDGMQVVSD